MVLGILEAIYWHSRIVAVWCITDFGSYVKAPWSVTVADNNHV
jgi:hypothetical protein